MVDAGLPLLNQQRPHCPAEAAQYKMEELALMTLLECPLCSEQLDVSAKVLPCQHTFCASCLQRHEAADAQLLCPECGAPAPARTVEELPANLLLVRLLEGLQGPTGPGSIRQSGRYAVPVFRGGSAGREGQQQQEGQHREMQGHSELAVRASIRNQRDDGAGKPALVPGNGITPKHKSDEKWHQGKAGDGSGWSLAASVQQAVAPAPQLHPHQQHPQPLVLCRALYNFNPEDINLEDSQYCLSFLKGDILSVIRRLDEHWIEAKLGDKVGICPLQFTEPISVAGKQLEGKSRRASDSADSHYRPGKGGRDKATDAANRTSQYGVAQVSAKTPLINGLSSSGHRKQPATGRSHLYLTTKGETNATSNINGFNRQGQPHQLSVPSAARGHSHPSRVNSHRIRRHSDPTHRHLLHSKKMSSETPPTISMALLNPQMSSASADSKNSSTQQLSISVCAVLYSYKPRRQEELELRKGEMVGVYGKFKEGWLRGLSLRTGKVGILPSNYVSPVLRTSARLLENKAATASSQYNTVGGRKPTSAKNPAVVLALDRVNTDGATGQVPSVPNGAQHAASSLGAGKPSFYGRSQGWDTVRRIFNPHRSSNHFSHMSTLNVMSNSQHFAQVQASGYSPAIQRKKSSNILSRPMGWMTEPAASSAGAILKDRDFLSSHEAAAQHEKQPTNGPHSILVRHDSNKNNIEKPAKSVRFITDEDPPAPRLRTSSWSSGSQVPSNYRSGPPPLEVWAPSLTLGRDGPGIILKEGKAPVLRKGLESAMSDLNSNPQKPASSAMSAQFSPSRHRVTTTHLAQTESEATLFQGEVVLVHRPRPDGRILVTQESSGQTGLFHSSVLQALERLS